MIIRVIFNPVKAKASIYQMKHGFANEAVRATEIRQGTFFQKFYLHWYKFNYFVNVIFMKRSMLVTDVGDILCW